MTDFFKVFPKIHVLLPVIHAVSMKQVIENIGIAKNEGADGVFLINMNPRQLPARALIEMYEIVRVKHPTFWIGFNFLGLDSFDLYFGGVAFKGQAPIKDPGGAARLAAPHMDVVTTSGDRTGSPPSVKKAWDIRHAIGPSKGFAVASGIDEENILDYPMVNAFLAASSITDSETEMLQPAKVGALLQRLGQMKT